MLPEAATCSHILMMPRKLFDYYTTPELNENFGKIEYEDEHEISDWIDIGQYMDYLLSSL